MIDIIKDVNIMEDVDKYDAIVISTNTYCSLGNGLQRDVALNYPYVDTANKGTKYGDISKVGTILTCSADNEPTFVLSYINKGYEKKDKPIDYNGLIECLQRINKEFKGKHIAMPLLGTSRFDGNFDKEVVLSYCEKYLTDCNVTIYDFFQKSRDEKQRETRKKELKLKEKSYILYKEAVRKRKEEAEKRFLRNGHARY